MVRKTYDSGTYELYVTDNVMTGSVQRFVKTNASGIITLTLIPIDTSALLFKGDSASYVYDIELYHNTLSTVLLVSKGNFNINRETTR